MPDFNGPDKINIRNFKKIFKEKQEIEKKLDKKDNIIAQLKNEKDSLDNEYQEKLETFKNQLQSKDEMIQNLTDKLEEVSLNKDIEKSIIQQMTISNIKVKVLEKEIETKAERLIEVENKLDKIKRENLRLDSQLENIQEAYQEEQLSKEELKIELNNLKENLQSAFKSDDISKYFNQAIDDFNKQVNQGDSQVNYIINSMDVDLKASIGRDKDQGLLMTSPYFGSKKEEALSQIKFTIRAVPRDMAGND